MKRSSAHRDHSFELITDVEKSGKFAGVTLCADHIFDYTDNDLDDFSTSQTLRILQVLRCDADLIVAAKKATAIGGDHQDYHDHHDDDDDNDDDDDDVMMMMMMMMMKEHCRNNTDPGNP